MKIAFFTLLFFTSFIVYSQNANSVEIYASPNYTNYTNKLVNDDGAISYNFGVGYNFLTEKEWNWTIGLRFADFATKYSNNNLRWGTQHNGQGGSDPTLPSGEGITGITFKNHYYFLEMPIGIKYRLLNKKIKLFVEPTVNPTIFLTHRNDIAKKYEENPDELEISSDGYSSIRKFNFFGEIGMGVEAPLGERLALLIRPSARVQLFSAAKDSVSKSKFYSMGVKLGVVYSVGN